MFSCFNHFNLSWSYILFEMDTLDPWKIKFFDSSKNKIFISGFDYHY